MLERLRRSVRRDHPTDRRTQAVLQARVGQEAATEFAAELVILTQHAPPELAEQHLVRRAVVLRVVLEARPLEILGPVRPSF